MRTRGVRRAGAGGAGSGAGRCGVPAAVVRVATRRYSCTYNYLSLQLPYDRRKDDHMKLDGLHHITMITADPRAARRETAGVR
jgi:hypothetical protein